MVRRGSPVRVRKRASRKVPGHPYFPAPASQATASGQRPIRAHTAPARGSRRHQGGRALVVLGVGGQVSVGTPGRTDRGLPLPRTPVVQRNKPPREAGNSRLVSSRGQHRGTVELLLRASNEEPAGAARTQPPPDLFPKARPSW